MKAIDIAREVTSSCGARLVRERKDAPGEYDSKPYFSGNKRKWLLLDLFTASAIVAVHDGLNEANRAKFAGMGIGRMADVAFKLLAKPGVQKAAS